VQLAQYPQRMKQIQLAMNLFWDYLEDVPGIKPHLTKKESNSTMGGWYNPVGFYKPEEIDGPPIEKFIQAVNAEGGKARRGIYYPLHLHPVFNTTDIYGQGKPTRISNSERDVRQLHGE